MLQLYDGKSKCELVLIIMENTAQICISKNQCRETGYVLCSLKQIVSNRGLANDFKFSTLTVWQYTVA